MIYERFRNEFSTFTQAQLGDVRRALEESIEARKKQEKDALIEEFSKKAEELGIDIKSLIQGAGKSAGGSKRLGKKVEPKYRIVAPDGTVHEWSGRGIKPKAFAPYSKEELNARFVIRR